MPQLLALQKDLHNKTVGDKFGEYVEADMKQSIIGYFENKDVIIIVADLGGEILACMAVMIAAQPFNFNSLVAYEISWNFKQGYKGLAPTMFDEIAGVLKKRGVKRLVTYTGLDNPASQRYFRMKGFKPVEASMYKEI